MKNKLNVLLADDDKNDHERIKKALLAVPGVKVSSWYNGMQLVDHLTSASPLSEFPDLVITDLYMPFAGGLQVLKKLRVNAALKQIPIYVFSRNFDSKIQSAVIENGAADFFRKPDDELELQEIIRGILSRNMKTIDA